jgi:hypothetical protein
VQELFAGAEQVDLVGHSTPINRYLKLGNWILDPIEAERLASYMPASVKRVRLIGCETAKTREGRAAVEALTQRGLLAYGTINRVYTTHFDKNGVKRIGGPGLREFLPGAAHTPPLSPAPPSPVPPGDNASSLPATVIHAPGVTVPHAHPTVPRPLAWLGRRALSVITAAFAVVCWLFWHVFASHKVPHRWIWCLLSPSGTEMPGLLTEPLLIYEITSGQKLWTLEILFDFKYARFYSNRASAAKRQRVYKIRGSGRTAKVLLESYLEVARHGVTLIDRHEEAGDRGGVLVRRERVDHQA